MTLPKKKQESTRFEDWFWREQEAETFVNTARYGFEYGFDAGVQAERERVQAIIKAVASQANTYTCYDICDMIEKKINE